MSTSPNLGLDLQTTGSNNGTWGVTLNTNQSIIDSRLGARVSVDCSGSADITVSASQGQNFFQTLTGTLTGNIKYILPSQGALYFIKNSTSGAYTVTVVNDALGTGVVVASGTSQLLASNPSTTTVYTVLPGSLGATSFTGQITSTVTTGTAPLVIASTTPVANLSIGGNAATATTLSGTLAVSVGGTGAATLTGLVVGNGTSAFTVVTAPSGTVVGTTDTQSLTNKRVTPRVTSIVSSATPTINTDNCDAVTITALATNITSMTTSLTGTPNNFDKLTIRIKDDGSARSIAWGASFSAEGQALPTTTVVSKVLTAGFIWNSVKSAWGCVATAQEN